MLDELCQSNNLFKDTQMQFDSSVLVLRQDWQYLALATSWPNLSKLVQQPQKKQF